MTLENYLAEAGAFATLTGIMAGFALSAVIQILTSSIKGRLGTATIVVFSAATVMFLFCLIVSILSFATAAELNSIPVELDAINTFAVLVLFGGLFVFLAGIGLAGWIRSRAAGIMTTIFALISMCLTAYEISTVLSIFM